MSSIDSFESNHWYLLLLVERNLCTSLCKDAAYGMEVLQQNHSQLSYNISINTCKMLFNISDGLREKVI